MIERSGILNTADPDPTWPDCVHVLPFWAKGGTHGFSPCSGEHIGAWVAEEVSSSETLQSLELVMLEKILDTWGVS